MALFSVVVVNRLLALISITLFICDHGVVSKTLPKCLNSSLSFSGLPAQLVRKYFGCEPQKQPALDWMSLRLLTTQNATCNDGTQAGYYLRRNVSSASWLLFLEGGWYCYDEKTCMDRISLSWRFSVTSSHMWSPKKNGEGIMSPDRAVNPTWWNSNHVYIPYCSSDVWTGNATRTLGRTKFHFHGALILEEIIKELLSNGMKTADQLLLTGSSAGGAGVLLNIDRIGDLVQRRAPQIEVRGLVDSGWFLDNGPLPFTDCLQTPSKCKQKNNMASAAQLWNSVLPQECTTNKTAAERHMCYYGYVSYPLIRRPVMILNWIYDVAQILNDNSGLVSNPKQLFSAAYVQYILQLGRNLIHSFKRARVRAVFAPSCIAHTSLTKRQWLRAEVNGKTLDDAIRCWYANTPVASPLGNNRSTSTSVDQSKSNKCSYHLVDTCAVPQCNTGCPPIQDPMTGAEINLPQIVFGNSQITLPDDLPQKKLTMLDRAIAQLDKTPGS